VTTATDRSEPRTAAALTARRRDTQAALGRVDDAITRLRREKTPVSIAAVARRALLTELRGGSPHVYGDVVASGATVSACDRRR
jgi:hypothetical protein